MSTATPEDTPFSTPNGTPMAHRGLSLESILSRSPTQADEIPPCDANAERGARRRLRRRAGRDRVGLRLMVLGQALALAGATVIAAGSCVASMEEKRPGPADNVS